MGRRSRASRKRRQKRKGLTVDRKGRSGHYQGHMYSEVYSDGKVYVYTAWNDNEEVVGSRMPFEAWVDSVLG